MSIRYDRGTIIIKGIANPPLATYDPRIECFRAPAFKYREICENLNQKKISFSDQVIPNKINNEIIIKKSLKLRPYQEKACEVWLKHKKGIIILPTGAGKTIIGLHLIQTLKIPVLVIVPTLALVEQWITKLRENFDISVGEFSGNVKEIQLITVTTYDSATINAEWLGNKFHLLIFDEIHHLAGKGYQDIARKYVAPFRLGLTATLESDFDQMEFYTQSIGPIVYNIEPEELAGKYLASYELKKILVDFTPEEQAEYDKLRLCFSQTLVQKGITIRSVKDFTRLIIRSGKDMEIRQALAAHRKMERLTFNSAAKVEELQKLLQEGRPQQNRIIIFTKYNDMVYQISAKFLIPCITHNTNKKERQEILQKFQSGEYSAIVASQVLDEGIDIPAANIGIILSGSSSHRAFIQRLGRILRPQENKTAILYEIITRDTKETRVAATRRRTKENVSTTE